jgi:hypothetical protein
MRRIFDHVLACVVGPMKRADEGYLGTRRIQLHLGPDGPTALAGEINKVSPSQGTFFMRRTILAGMFG